MVNNASNYLENRVMNTILGKSTTLVSLSTMWIALTNTTLTDAWTPLDTGEVPKAGTNYVRFKFTNTTGTNWTKGTTGGVVNKATFTFTTSASTGWGTVKGFAIVDSSSTASGNSWVWGDISPNQTVASGNTVRFTTGGIRVTTL